MKQEALVVITSVTNLKGDSQVTIEDIVEITIKGGNILMNREISTTDQIIMFSGEQMTC